MRIAMVSEHASPLAVLGGADAGGQNVHVAALARSLARMGHEVVVYTRRDDLRMAERRPLCDGVEVVHVGAGPPAPLPKDDLLPHMSEMGKHLAELLQWDRPDVVHTHFWMSALAALVGRDHVGWADQVGPSQLPIVHTFHALGSVKRRYQGQADTSPAERLRLERMIGVEVDHIVATCSDEVRELERIDIPPSKVTVVPCGVDVDRFAPDGPVHERPDAPTHRLLAVGRMVERKGFDSAIAALQEVPDAELLIAGGASAEELAADPEAVRLQARAQDLGVAERVRLLGSVPQDDMPGLIRSADVVLATPWYEPFGIVPLEAAACGRPVIASAVGGLLDTVVDGQTGILVPPRDPAELARAIRELLAEPNRREAYGKTACDRARSRYAWPGVAHQTAEVYDQVCAEAAVRTP